ncbi:MAG: hypothetical protein HOI95_27445 [Chromatiales bacterium]|nr:hypothetical protein [Chromatiales bacterium]
MHKDITSLAGPVNWARAREFARANATVSFADTLKDQLAKNAPRTPGETAGQDVLVGEIGRAGQTVSDLLMHNAKLKASTWDILSAVENRGKDYTNIAVGAKVYYNSESGHLRWSGTPQPFVLAPARPAGLAPVAPTALSAAVATPKPQLSTGTELGVIDGKTPTVSHLLTKHPTLGSDAWNILALPINKGKNFNALPAGVAVRIDPVTREISWQSNGKVGQAIPVASDTASPLATTASSNVSNPTDVPIEDVQPTLLGRLGARSPTVSHLLQKHPLLAGKMWAVLGNDVNRDKPFQKIPAGTDIYLQPGSMEIVWKHAGTTTQADVVPAPPSAQAVRMPARDETVVMKEGAPTDLTEAVKPFMGTPYRHLNCYELLVKGLEGMDIRYYGKDGLYTKLTRMAHDQGLPSNAFLTGEGIVEAAGATVLSRSFRGISDTEQQVEQLFREIEPLLDKGQILSFSTRTRGHTGIVSQHDDQWTFINSGRLDNSLSTDNPYRGVGEEDLKREIRNWFTVASTRGESLMVTLGALRPAQNLAASNPEGLRSRRT